MSILKCLWPGLRHSINSMQEITTLYHDRVERESAFQKNKKTKIFLDHSVHIKVTFRRFLKPIYTTLRNIFSNQSVDNLLKLLKKKSPTYFFKFTGEIMIFKIKKKNKKTYFYTFAKHSYILRT